MSSSIETWKRQKDESAEAYLAFRTFLELGVERTVVEAYRQAKGKLEAKQAPGVWNSWVQKFEWFQRARDYDAHLQVIADLAVEQATAQEAEKWAKRQTTIREDGWNLYLALKAKAELMLRFPVQRTKVNGTETIVEPADWNFNTAARMADTALKLGRLTAELSTENLDIDVSKLSDKQLSAAKRAIEAGQPIAAAIAKADRD